MNLIDQNLTKLHKLCNTHKVLKLYVFGSIVSKNFNSKSDIDFLVDFTDIDLEDYVDNYFDLKFALEDLFKRKIDLLETKALKNPYLIKSIDASKRIIYGHWNQNMAIWYFKFY